MPLYRIITISRAKLKKRDFTPDKVKLIEEPEESDESMKDFYQPAVELLFKMILERGEQNT